MEEEACSEASRWDGLSTVLGFQVRITELGFNTSFSK